MIKFVTSIQLNPTLLTKALIMILGQAKNGNIYLWDDKKSQ